jgi:hypothetical protein
MTRILTVAPIVEGHGEVDSIGILLRRLVPALDHRAHCEVLNPLRRPRSSLLSSSLELGRALRHAELKLKARENSRRLLLLLLDADSELPCRLAPQLKAKISALGLAVDCSVVLARKEFETWFIASAASLVDYLDVDPARIPADPENQGLGKAWVQERFRGRKYSEPVDQPRLTARLDFDLCRSRAPSFDKLCRELEAALLT